MTPNEYIEASEKVLKSLYPDELVPLSSVIEFMKEVRNCSERVVRSMGANFYHEHVQDKRVRDATDIIADEIRPPESMRAWLPYRKPIKDAV